MTKKKVLWIDDHFDEELGGLTRPAIDSPRTFLAEQQDRLLNTDMAQLARLVPNIDIVSETRLMGFTQQLLNHVRLAREMNVRAGRASIFSAFVVDIMISGVNEVPYPRLDAAGNVKFDDSGQVEEWDAAVTMGDGFDAGLVIADRFIFKERHLLHIPCIFYTHRNIDSRIEEQVRGFRERGGTAYVFEKIRGAGPVVAALRKALGDVA